MNNTTLIFHHNDNDGKAAAAIIMQNIIDIGTGDYKLIECDYTKTLEEYVNSVEDWANSKEVYILDYSISNDIDAQYLAKIYVVLGPRLIWIDHHKTSLEMLNNPSYDGLKYIYGPRINGISGCALTWIYNHIDAADINPVYVEFLNSYNNTQQIVQSDCAMTILRDLKCPAVLQYIHRYDIWDTSDLVINFKYGFGDKSAEDIRKIISGETELDLTNILNMGAYIYDNIGEENKEEVYEHSFIVDVNYKEATYKALALNTNRFTSLTFGDTINDFDLVIPFLFDGENWRYSMYTVKNNVDVSVLCKALGGGGHQKASGFSKGYFVFEKTEDGNYELNIN